MCLNDFKDLPLGEIEKVELIKQFELYQNSVGWAHYKDYEKREMVYREAVKNTLDIISKRS